MIPAAKSIRCSSPSYVLTASSYGRAWSSGGIRMSTGVPGGAVVVVEGRGRAVVGGGAMVSVMRSVVATSTEVGVGVSSTSALSALSLRPTTQPIANANTPTS